MAYLEISLARDFFCGLVRRRTREHIRALATNVSDEIVNGGRISGPVALDRVFIVMLSAQVSAGCGDVLRRHDSPRGDGHARLSRWGQHQQQEECD